MEAVHFYCSAFLSAARSVTLVPQAEDKDRYNGIFQPWLDALPQADRALFRSMSEFRRAEVHYKGVELEATTALIPLKQAPSGVWVRVAIDWKWLEEMQQHPEGLGMVVLVPRFNVGGQPAEVVATCQRYMALLSDLLWRWA